MSFCGMCGTQLVGNEKHCPKCGNCIVEEKFVNESIKKKDKKKLTKAIAVGCVGLVILLVVIFKLTFFNSELSPNANDDELQLIEYIIENGNFDSEKDTYTISESTMESEIYFNYSIEYDTKNQALIFKESSYVSGGITYAYMYYEYGANKQNVEITMLIDSDKAIKSTGVIYTDTYTSSNRTIHFFESTYEHDHLQNICESNIYTMLHHCQLLMIDAGTGLKPFGFEKGLYS